MTDRKTTKRTKRSAGSAPKKGPPPENWRAKFLAALAKSGNVSHSASVAHIDRNTAYNHRSTDAKFAEAWDHAIEESNDALESEARRRAVDGVNEPVVYQGEVMGVWVGPDGNAAEKGAPGAKFVPLTLKKYSDTLLIFLLNGNRPEKFRQNLKLSGNLEHKHSGEVTVGGAAPPHVAEVLAELERRRAGMGAPQDPGGEAEGDRPA